MHSQAENKTRRPRAPGILAVLPENLPYYPYNHQNDNNNGSVYKHLRKRGRKRPKESERMIAMEESGGEMDVIVDKPLDLIDGRREGFTLFFFVDSNNRQSLMSIPIVSKWYHYALASTDGDDNVAANSNDEGKMKSRVICIPNQPSPSEILHDSNTDTTPQASLNETTSTTTYSTTKCHPLSIIQGTGFYHLPFEHKSRLTLLHLLSATRVPSIIVVSNTTGRIITRYGWEAIEREGSGPSSLLERWIESSFVENKKGDEKEEMVGFESNVVREWNVGRSGLPLWWHLVSFIL